MQRNPSLVQGTAPDMTPLFLVHDGSGTTFSYYRLRALGGRKVYAIRNPRFESGRPWPGGIRKMAQVYAELIMAKVQAGPVLLGGWSLGGLIALEIADYLAKRSLHVHVQGVVMLDSGYPEARTALRGKTLDSTIEVALQRVDPQVHMMIRPMLQQAAQMTDVWTPPELLAPPPVVLLRCTQPLTSASANDTTPRVDTHRHDPFLGWTAHRPGLITYQLELQCGHFDVFDPAHVDQTTRQLARALDLIERTAPPSTPVAATPFDADRPDFPFPALHTLLAARGTVQLVF